MDLLMLSNDAVLAEEWRAELARLDPPIRLRLPGDDRQGDVVAALVDGPVDGRLADWRDIRLVIGLNAGVEDLLGDPTLPSIPLLRMVCPETVALMKEYVCHYVIRARGRFEGLEAAQRAGRWEAGPGFPPPAAFRVAVMGLGELVLPTAQSLRDLGYCVSGWSRTLKTVPGIACYRGRKELESMLATTDVLICMLPLTPATRGLICADLLAKLPRNASFINVGRGGCVVEADLLAGLDQDRLSHATLDVFEREPPPSDSPLWAHPRVTMTPHVAATPDTAACAKRVARVLSAVLQGEDVRGLVDRAQGY
jgi:glyoxylate/hydroxypyruvate reductase A